MPTFLSSRLLFLALFLGCSGMMGFGFYLQYADGLEPCPLCMSQRVFIVAVGVCGLLAALHNPARTGIRVYGVLSLMFAVIGGSISTRHIWLQSLPPDQAPACGPSVEYILDAFPLKDAIKIMLSGDGNCAEVTWTFLTLSIPQWTLVAFVGLAAIAIINIVRPIKY